MSITKYFDEKLGKEFFKVQIVRKSSSNHKPVVRKRAHSILNFADAQKIERKLNLEAERELITKENQGLSWRALTEEWMEAVELKDIFSSSVTYSTARDYLATLRLYTSEWNNLRVEEMDKALAWLVLDRVEKEVSISRRKRLRTAIDAVFNWGIL